MHEGRSNMKNSPKYIKAYEHCFRCKTLANMYKYCGSIIVWLTGLISYSRACRKSARQTLIFSVASGSISTLLDACKNKEISQ